MSDVSRGPGWWIASDGRWYPPTLHPGAAARPAGAAPTVVPRPEQDPLEAARTGPDPSTPSEVPPGSGRGTDGAPDSGPPDRGSAGEIPTGEVAADGIPSGQVAAGQAATGGVLADEIPAGDPGDATGLDGGHWVTVEVPGVGQGPAPARGRGRGTGPERAAEGDEATEAAIRGLLVLLAVAVVAALIVLVVNNSPPTSTTTATTAPHTTTVPPPTVASRLPSNPDQVVDTVVQAADSQGSVHLNARLTVNGQATQLDLDVGRIGADGTVVENGLAVKVTVIGGTIYVQGPAEFLLGIGLTAAEATRYDGVWLAIPTTTKGLAPLGAFNFPNLVDSLIDLAPPRSLSSPTGAASSVTLVHGALATTSLTAGNGAGDPATMTVASTPPFLPTRTTSSSTVSGVATYVYSLWGENVVLVAPTDAVPLAKVGAR